MAKEETVPENDANKADKQPETLDQINISMESITFSEPFNEDKAERIEMNNPTDKSVGFKVKITHPVYLSARPAYGFLKPNSGRGIRVKFRHLPERMSPATKDHLTFVFAFVPDDKAFDRPSDFWKGKEAPPEPCRRIVVNILYTEEMKHGDVPAKQNEQVEVKTESPPVTKLRASNKSKKQRLKKINKNPKKGKSQKKILPI